MDNERNVSFFCIHLARFRRGLEISILLCASLLSTYYDQSSSITFLIEGSCCRSLVRIAYSIHLKLTLLIEALIAENVVKEVSAEVFHFFRPLNCSALSRGRLKTSLLLCGKQMLMKRLRNAAIDKSVPIRISINRTN